MSAAASETSTSNSRPAAVMGTAPWTTYDAVRNNLPLLEDVPAVIQERAWSSPIWYTP